MGTSTCLLILAIGLALSLILAGWHIIAVVLHLVLAIVTGIVHLILAIAHALVQWPVIVLALVGLVVIWMIFFR